jgi:hypothetical protein
MNHFQPTRALLANSTAAWGGVDTVLTRLTMLELELKPPADIHKDFLHKKTGSKVNYFKTLFINVCLAIYLTFYRTDLSTIKVQTSW